MIWCLDRQPRAPRGAYLKIQMNLDAEDSHQAREKVRAWNSQFKRLAQKEAAAAAGKKDAMSSRQ